MLTWDGRFWGQRHKDLIKWPVRAAKIDSENIVNMATAALGAGDVAHLRRGFGNIVGHVSGVDDMSSLSAWTAAAVRSGAGLGCGAVGQISGVVDLIIKPVFGCGGCALAAQSGADALVVSNHGGRQLDGAPSVFGFTEIVDAVGSQIDSFGWWCAQWSGCVACGHWVRRRCTSVGPFLYGLGAMGRRA